MTVPDVTPDGAVAPYGTVGWVDVDALLDPDTAADWIDTVSVEDLIEALDVAHDHCLDFLNGRIPRPRPDGRPRARLVMAQKLQARALLRASYVGTDNEVGLDGMAVTVYPMDWTVKNLLRPKRGRRGPT